MKRSTLKSDPAKSDPAKARARLPTREREINRRMLEAELFGGEL